MPERDAVRVGRLILVPAIITLAVTLGRLAGELMGASDAWFSRAPGGKAALFGIVWLIPLFGIYFGLRLDRAGEGPSSVGKAAGLALAAFAVNVALLAVAFATVKNPLAQNGILALTSWIALLVPRRGWPALWRVLLAYALAARIPVLIVMFLSIFGAWDTHYAKARPDFPPMGPWSVFFWAALLPQLSIWIFLTIAGGTLFGTLAAAVRRMGGRSPSSSLP